MNSDLLIRIIFKVIDKTNNIEHQDNLNYQTALLQATVFSGRVSLKILTKKQNINYRDIWGYSELLSASRYFMRKDIADVTELLYMFKVQKKLLDMKCNVLFRNINGNTFFDITIRSNQYKILKYYYLRELK